MATIDLWCECGLKDVCKRAIQSVKRSSFLELQSPARPDNKRPDAVTLYFDGQTEDVWRGTLPVRTHWLLITGHDTVDNEWQQVCTLELNFSLCRTSRYQDVEGVRAESAQLHARVRSADNFCVRRALIERASESSCDNSMAVFWTLSTHHSTDGSRSQPRQTRPRPIASSPFNTSHVVTIWTEKATEDQSGKLGVYPLLPPGEASMHWSTEYNL